MNSEIRWRQTISFDMDDGDEHTKSFRIPGAYVNYTLRREDYRMPIYKIFCNIHMDDNVDELHAYGTWHLHWESNHSGQMQMQEPFDQVFNRRRQNTGTNRLGIDPITPTPPCAEELIIDIIITVTDIVNN